MAKPSYPRIDEQYPDSGDGPAVKLRCPYCGRSGTFEKLGVRDVVFQDTWFGQRRCPNDECRGHLFFIQEGSEFSLEGTSLRTYPHERMDFDRDRVPEAVAAVFDEAIACLANGFHRAAALLVRRTLEAAFAAKSADGPDPAARVKALGVPEQLAVAVARLGLFAADADGVDAAAYGAASADEVQIAAELTREIIKAAFQYDDLLARLESLQDGGQETEAPAEDAQQSGLPGS